MVKITSIEIDGFITPSQSVKLDFVESNIICIYGNNGSGKTTFLEILFAVFDRDEEILRKYNVANIKIKYIFDNIEIKKQIVKLKDDLEELSNEYEIDTIKGKIRELEKEINIAEKVIIEAKYNSEDKLTYYFDNKSLNNSKLFNCSTLFLGIGRGVHKNELKIPKEMIWHFFRNNKKISENKILTGNEIDDFSNRLIEYLTPKDVDNEIEIYKAKALDDSQNIYLPNIEIDTIEAFLNNKYKEAVLDAKARIKESLFKTSFNFFKSSFSPDKSIDLEKLQEKLIYNKLLLLEMLSSDEDIEIETVFESLEKDKNFLEQIGTSQQVILSSIVEELNSEVELFNEIQIFLNEYNKFLNYNKKLVLSANGIYVAPENHPIDKLSSGERHLLTFLATILLMGEEQDFILLDEPEISLDIEWQEKLLSTISKLAPDSQIIVTSHSSTIWGENLDETVEIIPQKV